VRNRRVRVRESKDHVAVKEERGWSSRGVNLVHDCVIDDLLDDPIADQDSGETQVLRSVGVGDSPEGATVFAVKFGHAKASLDLLQLVNVELLGPAFRHRGSFFLEQRV
jgi:hypothetical protein